MLCPSCSTEVRPGQKFCMECGASLRGVADDTGEVPPIRASDDASDHVHDEVSEAIGGVPAAGPGPAEQEDRPAEEVTARVDPLLRRSEPARSGAPTTEERFYGERAPWQNDPYATVQMPSQQPGERPTNEVPAARTDDRTQTYQRPAGAYAATVAHEHEYVYDSSDHWEDEWAEEGVAGHFRFRVLFVLAVLAAAATVVGVLSILIEIRTESGEPAPFDTGTWMVNDFGTNNTVAALLAAGAIVVGAFLWCFGFRWGAGLAGGGGLALSGWAALLVGLAEWPIFQADRASGAVPTDISRELGYWGLVAAGGLGIIVFLASLNGSGRDRQGGLDPWIAALGAASFLVAAGGPMIPLGTADFSGNYSSETLGVDLPSMFFVGRLVQIGLLGFTGIVGFLLVRRYGLGLAIGGATAAGFMLATAATEQTATPIGPAFANPGAGDLAPHGVTIVGMALAGFFALVAVVMAVLDSER